MEVFHTSSMGASKTRVIMISRSVGVVTFVFPVIGVLTIAVLAQRESIRR
jgi:hypothetical protein